MKNVTLGFIGAGNMANSLIRGLLADGTSADSILIADIDSEKLKNLQAAYGVQVSDNQGIAEQADIIVLAVKPQVMKSVCTKLDLGERNPLVVSIAAGIPLASLQSWIKSEAAIIRCMPNTPALVGKGASGLFANERTSEEQKSFASQLMGAIGISVWVKSETAIDAVTAISGSGPAYFFLFLEAMQEAAADMGLEKDVAELLCVHTALGAAELALQSEDDVGELRRQVTSPGGTTERALREFESGGLRDLVRKAVLAAKQRSEELARDFGDD